MKKEESIFKSIFNFSAALAACLLVRLIPLRAPNVEPILTAQMPLSKAYGAGFGFVFGLFSILIYDLITHTAGVQTIFTAGAYALLGLFAGYYFRKGNNSISRYVSFAVLGTLFYDAVTGLTVGPILFHESFSVALLGQIPFTLLHLFGNIAFAILLSPAIYKLLVRKKSRVIPKEIETYEINPNLI